ncbi:hypothetical protein [Kibdelosporangium philippinense]|uniref:hypothetical protein n=1 Tax=Kibdelosporangium philippinense TaxID=211113 RepID=UPI00360CB0F4
MHILDASATFAGQVDQQLFVLFIVHLDDLLSFFLGHRLTSVLSHSYLRFSSDESFSSLQHVPL